MLRDEDGKGWIDLPDVKKDFINFTQQIEEFGFAPENILKEENANLATVKKHISHVQLEI